MGFFKNAFQPDYTKSKYGNSSWWLGGHINEVSDSLLSRRESGTVSSIKKSAAKRSVSNFVNIVTQKPIQVEFNSSNRGSYTDGKTVYISSQVDQPKEFDLAVGLALHEASHIKLSDFPLLRNLNSEVARILGTGLNHYQIRCQQFGIPIIETFKDIFNWVEDRRIDQFIYDEAPGYQGYYQRMYDEYFNSKMIDDAMRSTVYSDETLESYMFHLINLHSRYANPKALKRLPEINHMVDLDNIGRLKNSKDALVLAAEVFKCIIDAIKGKASSKQQQQPQQKQSGQSGGGQQGQEGKSQKESSKPEKTEDTQSGKEESEKDESQSPNNESEDEDGNGDGNGSDKDKADEDEAEPNGSGSSKDDTKEDQKEAESNGNGDDDTESEDEEEETQSGSKGQPSKGNEDSQPSETPTVVYLSPEDIELLQEAMQKQKDFLNGKVEKATMSQDELEKLKTIEEAKSEIKLVGQDFTGGGVECIVVKNLTANLLKSGQFPLNVGNDKYLKEVEIGIKNGIILGKKLQTRSESRETVWNRQEHGKIDKRQVSSLGYGQENVFFTKEIDMYKKANLHISVDASGSMEGEKWRKTMINIVSIAKAVDMIPNLQIQISFRTTSGGSFRTGSSDLPYIVIAYDSRVDKFTKIKQMFPSIGPNNTTPEGLCFESILKNMVPTNKEVDSYFLNLSDGEPYYSGKDISYTGRSAAKHTARMVGKIKAMDIRVLSYFISDTATDRVNETFQLSYGKDAHAIDVTHMGAVARTINALFMSKG